VTGGGRTLDGSDEQKKKDVKVTWRIIQSQNSLERGYMGLTKGIRLSNGGSVVRGGKREGII